MICDVFTNVFYEDICVQIQANNSSSAFTSLKKESQLSKLKNYINKNKIHLRNENLVDIFYIVYCFFTVS